MNLAFKIWLKGCSIFLIVSLILVTIVGLSTNSAPHTNTDPDIDLPLLFIIIMALAYFIGMIIISIPTMILFTLALKAYKKYGIDIKRVSMLSVTIMTLILYSSEALTTGFMFRQTLLDLLSDPISQTPILILVFSILITTITHRNKVYNIYNRSTNSNQ